jgi:hypothetical protein
MNYQKKVTFLIVNALMARVCHAFFRPIFNSKVP